MKRRGKLAETVKVNCLGSRHRVGLSESGRLILFDHPKGDEDEVAALLLFNPEFRCRCHEIRDVWRWYTRDRCSPGWYELKTQEEFAWILTAFQNDWGNFEVPTDSRLLAQLPKALRDYAREAYDRRYRGYRPPRLSNRTYWQEYEGTYRRKSRKGELEKRKMQRLLLRNSGFFRMPERFDVKPTSDDIIICHDISEFAKTHGYPERDWFKACLDVGVIPTKFPPHNIWKRRSWVYEAFPQMIKGGVIDGTRNRQGGRYLTAETWVGIEWVEETKNYIVTIGK